MPASEDAAEGRRRSPLEEVRRSIRAAALTPIERDGRFAVREGAAGSPTGKVLKRVLAEQADKAAS